MLKAKCALVILLLFSVSSVPTLYANDQFYANIISINSDGTMQPSNSPLVRSGDVYTLTGNFSGSISVHRSNIVIDGSF